MSPGKIGELLDKLVKHQRKWRNHQGNEENPKNAMMLNIGGSATINYVFVVSK